MHQSVGNSLRVLRQMNPPIGANTPQALLDSALANAMYATRASYHSGLNTTPGAMGLPSRYGLEYTVSRRFAFDSTTSTTSH